LTLIDALPEWTGALLLKFTLAQLQFCQPLSSESV
jgi:hypothetical protein